MHNHFQSEITLILIICACCLGLGVMTGFPLTGLIFGLVGYIFWILYQIRLLSLWLQAPEENEPPHLQGIFEVLLDRSLRVTRQHSHDKQLLRATLKRQNRLIAGVRDSVLLVGKDNRVSWFNDQATALLNIKGNEDIGIPLGNLFRDPRFFAYIEAENYAEPILVPAPGNRSKWMELSITKYEHGEKIIVLRDVTRMQRLEQMRSDFIANLSHELRTPLTVLRGYIETLLLQPNLDASIERIYGEMDSQSNRMAQLLADLATLSKLESNDASRSPVPVDVSALLLRIIQDANQLASYENHVFSENIKPDLWLTAVEGELYSAFSNLIFNAVRHTPAETEIQIKLSQDKSFVWLEVSDNGPGIDAKHLPRITERFYRVDASRNSGSGGTGLGLAIVKHAISAQGGELSIESTFGKGSRFRCQFPIHQVCDPEIYSNPDDS